MALEFAGFAQWLFVMFQAYGPLSLLAAVLVEEVIVPIPSPLVLMAAGAVLIPAGTSLAQALQIALFTITIPGAIGATLGALVIYAIGYYGGAPILHRFHRFFNADVGDMKRATKKLEQSRRIWISIVVLRAIFIMPTFVVSLAAGVVRLNWKKFALATFIGSLPRIFVLSLIGWQLGSAYADLANTFGSLANAVLVCILALGLVFVVYMTHRKKGARNKQKISGKKAKR